MQVSLTGLVGIYLKKNKTQSYCLSRFSRPFLLITTRCLGRGSSSRSPLRTDATYIYALVFPEYSIATFLSDPSFR